MRKSCFAAAVLIFLVAIFFGSFIAPRALSQKAIQTSPLAGKVSSEPEKGAQANTLAVAPANAAGLPQLEEDKLLPGSGLFSQSAPFYTVANGFMTMLMLNNGTQTGFFLKVTLYSLEGRPAELPPIHLRAHETKEIDLNEWVAGLGNQFATGSLRLDYRSTGYGLGAMVMMVNERQSIEVDVLARPPWEFKSNRLEAMWWMPEPATEIQYAVQNTAAVRVLGKLNLTDADGHAMKSMTLDMAPHQTRVYNLPELLEGTAKPSAKVGGISIEHLGRPGDLRAQSFILRRNKGFSASLQFEDPKAVVDSVLEGAGILVGNEEGVSLSELFSGHLLLRNVSLEAVDVKLRVQRGILPYPLPEVHLEAGEAKEVFVPAHVAYSLDQQPGATGATIQYSGRPGSILAYWFSVDGSGSLVVETPLRSPATLTQAGSNPWSLEGDYSSVLYVKNSATAESSFVAEIFYTGGNYLIGMITLKGGETTAIDIRKLRAQQIPDVNGHKLPLGVTAGQINWRTRNGEPRLIGRVNTMSVSKGLANNMSCQTCSCGCPSDTSVSLQPSSWTGSVGSTFSLTPWETNSGCSQTYPISTSLLTWSSDNPSVASVNQSASVSCQAGGSANVSGDGFFNSSVIDNSIDPTSNGCFFCTSNSTEQKPSTPVKVQVPDHLLVVADQQGVPAMCPSTGIQLRQMQMVVVDVNGNTVSNSPSVAESQSPAQPANSCGNGSPVPSSCAPTAADSTFIDNMAVSQNLCNSGINFSSGCGFTVTSTWSACGTSGVNPLWVSPRTTKSNLVTVDGNSTQFMKGATCNGTGCH